MRSLIVVLGDQLDPESSAFDGFDARHDAVWMAEVASESTHVWSHKARIAIFLSAMRHFHQSIVDRGYPIHYRRLDDPRNLGDLGAELTASCRALAPRKIIVSEPGEYRVRQILESVAAACDVPLEVRIDRHFLSPLEDFRAHASGLKQLRMEFFYREMRSRHRILLDVKGKPIGGKWNFDEENRGSFPKSGPGLLPAPTTFPPDAITDEVIQLVNERFPGHPGKLARFDWPVTPAEAAQALDDFITHRLPLFGQFQDAMWTDQPHLYHSRLSSSLNLKLLNPRMVIERAEKAYLEGHAPLASVEGFIRQIIGWREYVRGVYWQFMPDYLESNVLEAHVPLPSFYWTGDTDMACMRQSLGQTLDFGYAHHIQRLMVTGLYSLLLGVEPRAIHEWYLAIYIDAVEWVELPNVIGMSQFADGGRMSTKPYIASGKYIQRMSNYCSRCRYDPAKSSGENACPFTTLYWDFLFRHETFLYTVPRMEMQLRNITRISVADKATIKGNASLLRSE